MDNTYTITDLDELSNTIRKHAADSLAERASKSTNLDDSEQTLISGVLNCRGNYFEKRLSSENAIPYKSYGGEPSSSLHPRPTLARPPAGPYASLSVIYGFNWFL